MVCKAKIEKSFLTKTLIGRSESNLVLLTSNKSPFRHVINLLIDRRVKNRIFSLFALFQQVQYVDVILCNRYYAWYQDAGQTQLISRQLEGELRAWFDKFHKPVVQSEYGADTIAGFHTVS